MEKNKNKELRDNTIIFAIGTIGSKAIQFILVPLYTTFLSTEEYSTADIIVSTISLIFPLLTIGIGNGVIRYVVNHKENEKSALRFSLTICCIGTCIIVAFMPFILKIESFEVYGVFFPILFLTYSVKDTLANYCKAIGNNRQYAIDGIISSIALTTISILLISFAKLGVKGYLVSTIVAQGISILYLSHSCNVCCTLKNSNIDKELSREMVRYSLPLMPNGLFWWIIQMSDRYMVLWLCGESCNGIYSIAYRIPGIFNLVVSIFIQAFGITAIKECDNQKTEIGKYDGKYFGKVYEKYIAVSFVSASLVLLFSQPISNILIKNEFQGAWRYVPLLLCAYAIGNLQAFYGSIYSGIKKSNIVLLSTMAGAIANIMLNYMLISKYGAFGASIATIASYFIVYIMRVLMITKYINMDHYLLKNIISIAFLCTMAVSYVWLGTIGKIVAIIFAIVMIALYKDTILSLVKNIGYGVRRRFF